MLAFVLTGVTSGRVKQTFVFIAHKFPNSLPCLLAGHFRDFVRGVWLCCEDKKQAKQEFEDMVGKFLPQPRLNKTIIHASIL